ncbi:MAG: amidophosphoribosyltransferase [Bacteroidetes bacterium]|nr:amidophosphoribosyltransferase [Bacteroidota bacterium]
MSDSIKHECGIAFIRLLKPLEYFKEKYNEPLWGLSRIRLLMVKQLNRGQDGSGIGVVKLNPEFGHRYIARKRSNSKSSVADLFEHILGQYNSLPKDMQENTEWLKTHFPYAGEVMLGHLRYGTEGGNKMENIHPFLRQNNWMSRNLMIAGNHNLTNVDELFQTLIDLGQQPKEISSNVTMLEKIGHFLDEENEIIFRKYKDQGVPNIEITEKIKQELNLAKILKRSVKDFDGAYNLVGIVGNGDSFIIRDPNGIRPSYYYANDEFIVGASERAAICTVFDLQPDDVKELERGHALIIKADKSWKTEEIMPAKEKKSCSFERIYFSRGNDRDIYKERRMLGQLLAPEILKKLNYDLENTVLSYVPNTAATCFYGLIDGINDWLDNKKIKDILNNKEILTEDYLQSLFRNNARREKVLIKDTKIRTFITNEKERGALVGSVYDITYGSIKPKVDNLVIVDDSIVRGTTMRDSILSILGRLSPKKVIVVSSCPQIRYPDCYGIDMSRMKEFVAFNAVLELLKEKKMTHKLEEVYQSCKAENQKPLEQIENKVKDLYNLVSEEEITKKISEILTPKDFEPEVEIVFQSIEGLHKACPDNLGDWYFSGDYPTPGGNRVVNRSFCYFYEKNPSRAY